MEDSELNRRVARFVKELTTGTAKSIGENAAYHDMASSANDAERGPGASAESASDGPWSKADTPSRWAKRFGISRATFVRRVTDGKIRGKRLSSKSYLVHSDDVPSPSSDQK